MSRLALLLLALALALPVSAVRAQSVVLEPSVTQPGTTILREVLGRGDYLLIDRDTVLAPEFHLPGDLIVYDARVRLEGAVAGTVVVVTGSFFVRPGARVEGPIVALGGLVLPSGLSEIGEIIELAPEYTVTTWVVDGTLRVAVRDPPGAPAVVLGGVFGVRHLAYDRVDGFSVSWGPQWRVLRREAGPVVDGWVTLRTARARQGGGVRLNLPLGGELELTAGAARTTQTNERWIRDDLLNSVGALFLGRDLRDYYESDAVWATLGRSQLTALAPSGLAAAPFLTVRGSRDRSLASRAPWSIAGRSRLDRPNLPVLDTSLVSVEAGTLVGWQGRSARFRAQGLIEHARDGDGDLRFTHWLFSGRWDMEALWNHSLTVSGHAVGTLGDGGAPPQRWSFVGGIGTLPTLPVAALRGDRLVFIRSEYLIPVPVVDLPLVGAPVLEFVHATGTAWRTGTAMPAWEQNLGAGVRLSALRAQAWIDPTVARPRVVLLLDIGAP